MATETEIISLRFVGPQLNITGIPIYDLAESLTAIQRIFHKAYLSQNNQLSRARLATKAERSKLSLRLGERRRNSDEYGLTAFLADPSMLAFYGSLAANLIGGITLYALQKKLDSTGDEETPPTAFNVAIYNQVSSIANRIGGTGNIEKVEIKLPTDTTEPSITIDQSTKDHVRKLKKTLVRGEERVLAGRVRDFDPNRFTTNITDGILAVEVKLTADDFKKIRYSEIDRPWLTVTGVPIYRLGVETDFFESFEATSIVSIEGTDGGIQ